MTAQKELKDIFAHFDGDKNGRIDRGEFKLLIDALGAGASDEELDIGFDIIDTDNTGTIDFAEFSAWWDNR